MAPPPPTPTAFLISPPFDFVAEAARFGSGEITKEWGLEAARSGDDTKLRKVMRDGILLVVI